MRNKIVLFAIFIKGKKDEKYGAEQGAKMGKRFFQLHASSTAVRADRFKPPNVCHNLFLSAAMAQTLPWKKQKNVSQKSL